MSERINVIDLREVTKFRNSVSGFEPIRRIPPVSPEEARSEAQRLRIELRHDMVELEKSRPIPTAASLYQPITE